ncbi:E3 ubiquitin-protein ligase RNF34-like [Ctenocephalides felis]|uniref:E3 ubiquitin-protein ligase RNF34-like n=1 Tax=Ctenocephalides felis TaxID=7515 RepID=UPI000E6E1442|nr:E3 ubiquitin-protein ligase RNF34-like [Ctenocephalides felis]
MPCTNCSVQFGVFKRKKQCHECRCYFCNLCLRIKRDRVLCGKCIVLTSRPLSRSQLLQLKSKDLIIYLKSIHVSTSGCVEKEDLVNLLLAHVNSEQYYDNSNSHQNHQSTSGTGNNGSNTSNLFKQFNLQNLWASVQEKYDNVRCRPSAGSETAQAVPRRVYTRVRPPYHQQAPRPTTASSAIFERTRTESEPSENNRRRTNLLDTQDCVEIEDIGDWEFLSRTGEPLSSSDPQIIVEVTPPPEGTSNLSYQIRRTTSEIDVHVNINQSDHVSQGNTIRRHSIHNVDLIQNQEPNAHVPSSGDSETNLGVEETQESMNISQESINNPTDTDNPQQNQNRTETFRANNDDHAQNYPAPKKRINLIDITDINDLDDLSVKQLKELLIANRVDFKGCCEKNELLERVNRLWREYSQNREKLDDLPTDELCKICMDAPVECVMLECGHLATCTACGKRLNECPICRQYVVRVVRTFKA